MTITEWLVVFRLEGARADDVRSALVLGAEDELADIIALETPASMPRCSTAGARSS